MKEELLDFLEWFAGNEDMSNIHELEQIVDIYLKAKNSLPQSESKIINDHEVEKEYCECGRKLWGGVHGEKYCPNCNNSF